MHDVVLRYNPGRAVRRFDPNVMLGDDSTSMFVYDGLGGFSLKKIAGNITKAVGKAVKDTAHVTGNIVTSKIGQAVIGGGLALTGVGLPAAALIGAGAQAAGGAIKSGGGLKASLKGAAIGAGEGAAGSLAGKALGMTGVGSSIQSGARGIVSRLTGGRLMNDDAAQAQQAQAASAQLQAQAQAQAAADNAQLQAQAKAQADAQIQATNARRAAAINRSAQGSFMAKMGAGLTLASPLLANVPGANVVTSAVNAMNNAVADASAPGATVQNVRKAAGQARDTSKKLGGQARSLADRARVLREKADRLAKSGDLGAGPIAQEAERVAATAAVVQTAADNAANVADRVGEGIVAATDAGIGAAGTNSAGLGTALAAVTQNPVTVAALGIGTILLFHHHSRGSR